MRVLVTGGAGFIGSSVVRKLIGDSHEVVVLDDLSTGHTDYIDGLDLRLIRGSVLDSEAVSAAAKDCAAIVHLAAIGSVPQSLADPVSIFNANVLGSMTVFEHARTEGCQVVFAGSASVFGANPDNPKGPTSWTRPLSPYGSSKLAAESYLLSYAECFGFPALSFRFFNVYGPRQRPDHPYAAAIPRFTAQALLGLPVTIYGDGLQDRDFISVGTVAGIVGDAINRRVSCAWPVSMATGHQTTILDTAAEILRLSGSSSQIVHVAERAADIRFSQGSPDELRELFPGITSIALSAGLQETIDWMRDDLESGRLTADSLRRTLSQ